MYFFETIIFIVVGLVLVFFGYVFGKKGTDAFNDLKNIFRNNKKK